MLKRLTWFFAVLAALVAIWAPRPTAAAETSSVVLHKRIYRDVRLSSRPDFDWTYESGPELTLTDDSFGLNGAHFRLYDATSLLQTTTAEELAELVGQMTCKQAVGYATSQGLAAAGPGSVVTATVGQEDGVAKFSLPTKSGGEWAAYLIIETKVDADTLLNVDLEKKAVPLLLIFPTVVNGQTLNPVHIYPKNVGYVRDPYFFKFGVTAGGAQHRLAGAVFALFQYDEQGRKRYLDQSPVSDLKNSWVYTDQPLTHPDVELFISDDDGLVNTGERFLPAGTYYFEELKSIKGYTNNLGEHGVKVVVPDSWVDDSGRFRPVTVNGQPLIETIAGDVTAEALALGRPRVYNYQTAAASTKPTGSAGTKRPSWLPSTGTVVNLGLMLLGLTLMIVMTKLMMRRERR